MYYALPESTCEKLLSCSSGFAVSSSEERQLVWGLVMGFSIVCKRQGAMDMLTSTESMEACQWNSYREGHYQRYAACDNSSYF